jgi:hypothetical protein
VCESAATAAAATHFKSHNPDVEPCLTRDFRLQAFKQGARELFDSPALEAGKVHVIDVRLRLIKVLLAVQVHEIQFIDQTQLLEEFQGSVDRGPVNSLVALPRQLQQTRRVKMAVRVLDRLDKDLSLSRDADASQGEFLQQ